jgi:hypothetical protein
VGGGAPYKPLVQGTVVEYIGSMTLWQAAQSYPVAGLDYSILKGQEDAFNTCVTFLEGVDKIKAQNRRHGSYGLKHIVEYPSGRFGIPSSWDCYTTYIYEGTFILAALASGFSMDQRYFSATFNISERSLRRRTREFANEFAKTDSRVECAA